MRSFSVTRWLLVSVSAASSGGCVLILGYGDPVIAAEGSRVDAGAADATPEIDQVDARASFCASSSATFCASFDGTDYLREWPAPFTSNTRIERDTSRFTSAPASFRVTVVEPREANSVGNVALDFPAQTNKPFILEVGFDVRVEAATPVGAFAVLSVPVLVFTDGQAPVFLQLVAAPTDDTKLDLTLSEIVGGTDQKRMHPLSVGLVRQRWARLAIRATRGASGESAVVVRVDGVDAFSGPLELPLGPGEPSASVGFNSVSPNTESWDVSYDSVEIDMK